MPRVPGMKALPWMRVVWLFQIIFGAFQELEAHERKQAREIAARLRRDRRISEKDRQAPVRLGPKAGKRGAPGAAFRPRQRGQRGPRGPRRGGVGGGGGGAPAAT